MATTFLLALTACAPVPMTQERAERLCLEDVRQADGVSGEIGIGVGSDGGRARGSITVTDRVLNPQSEDEFLAECIDRRMSGRSAPPTIGITIGGRT